MMRPMENRSAVVAALLAASLTSLAASARLYLWPDAPGPVLLSPPPPLAIPPTAPAATRSVEIRDRKSTRLNSSHSQISYAVFCLKKKKTEQPTHTRPSTTLTDLNHRPDGARRV